MSHIATIAADKPRKVADNSDLVSLTYDGARLAIRVASEVLPNMQIGGIEIIFNWTRGFRCLDESDLSNYWISQSFLPGYHVLEVQAGGWSDEEDARRGYARTHSEWLIVTGNLCLSVFSSEPPEIKELQWLNDA